MAWQEGLRRLGFVRNLRLQDTSASHLYHKVKRWKYLCFRSTQSADCRSVKRHRCVERKRSLYPSRIFLTDGLFGSLETTAIIVLSSLSGLPYKFTQAKRGLTYFLTDGLFGSLETTAIIVLSSLSGLPYKFTQAKRGLTYFLTDGLFGSLETTAIIVLSSLSGLPYKFTQAKRGLTYFLTDGLFGSLETTAIIVLSSLSGLPYKFARNRYFILCGAK